MAFDIYSNEKFTELIFNWSQSEDEELSNEVLGKSVVSLVIDMELANRQITNANEATRKKVHEELIEKNTSVPRTAANQTVSQEVIHKFLIEDFDGAIDLVVSHIQENENIIKEHISVSQRKKAQQPRTDLLNQVLMEILEANPQISTSEVIDLLSGYSNPYKDYIYIEDEEMGITIEESDSKTKHLPTSRLKNRLSRLRIKMFSN
jgi:hypothetical protein